MTLFSTKSNPKLAKRVVKLARFKMGKCNFSRFASNERFVQIKHSPKDEVIIFGSTQQPDENIFDFLMLANAAQNATKHKLTAVIPYFGYARQDRAEPAGSAIAAELIAKMIESAGVNRLFTVDIHSAKAASYFQIEHHDLSALPLFAQQIRDWEIFRPVIVAPDKGAKKRAQALADQISDASFAWIEKKRTYFGNVVARTLTGDVKNRDAFIVDDMIDTGSTIIAATRKLKLHGARSITVMATHGIFSKNAFRKMKRAGISQVVVTDTIPQTKKAEFLTVLSIAPILADQIK